MKMGNLKRGKISGPLWVLLRAGNRTKVDASKGEAEFQFCNKPMFFAASIL
jgi:hypothetical protein